MANQPKRKKGHGTNPVSPWGTGGSALDGSSTFSLPWNPDSDFIPAWIPLSQLTSSEMPFDSELPQGESQRSLPFYVNNDGIQDGADVLVLGIGEENLSVGFSQETYILQESWDSTAGDVAQFGTGSPIVQYPRNFPSAADLDKMFLVNDASRPAETPKLIAGGQFLEVTIIIEDAQSTTPSVTLDQNDNTYFVTTGNDSQGVRPGAAVVYGKGGNDQIIGSNAGKNRLLGEAGNDILNGGLSEDILSGGSGADTTYGAKGDDILFGLMGDDILWGDYEENYRRGSNLNGTPQDLVFDRDILYGGSGNDALYGGAGADLLFGGDGIDYLSPGKKGTSSHPQYAVGGTGADRFDFYTDPWLSGTNLDISSGKEFQERMILADFDASEGDKIGIYVGTNYESSFSGYYTGLPENVINISIPADWFRAGTEALDENDRFIYHNTLFSNGTYYGNLYFDADGVGSLYPRAFLAEVYTTAPLTHQDIVTFNDSNRLPPASPPPQTQLITDKDQIPEIENVQPPVENVVQPPENENDPVRQENEQPNNNNETFDNITGLPASRVIMTGNGNNVLRGGAEDNVLKSGRGNDRMIGGDGKDIFVLERGRGRDIIQDFQNGQDRLGLTTGMRFKKLNITRQGRRDTLISLGKDELVLLKGIRVGQLSAADFTSTFSLDVG